MDIHEPYQLAASVVFIPSGDIPADDHLHLSLSPTDVVITQGDTRKRSKALNEVTAALLQQFKAPATLATALFQFAQDTKQDAARLADDAFPLLVEMAEEGYLVTASSVRKRGLVYSPGETFRQYTIVKKIQAFDDNAVYKVKDLHGVFYAVKLFEPGEGGGSSAEYENERRVLQQLDGVVNPALCDFGEADDRYFLATTWVQGRLCEAVAAGCRNWLVKKNVLALLDLCVSVAAAFHHLHQQGVLHGDVHPANVLVSASGAVSILDYGVAAAVSADQRPVRSGIDFYYEPELAASLLHTGRPTPLTAAGEQYSVAVLLYKLLAGHHYLHFSYEPTLAYRQIAEERPFSFAYFDLQLPPAFDAVFAKALAKNPAERYASLAELVAALADCRRTIEESPDYFQPGQGDADERLVQTLLRRYTANNLLLRQGLMRPPSCSVNYGSAGIAYFLYRAAAVYREPKLLDAADVWANHAGDYDADFDQAFYSPADEITLTTVGRRALYHSPTGVHLVQAMISSARGDGLALQQALDDYLRTLAADCKQVDLTLGKAGLLLGSGLLWQQVPQLLPAGKARVAAATNALLDSLWQQLNSLPPLTTEKTIDYFGIAHGWAGLLYATLFWCGQSGQNLPDQFRARLEQLLALATEAEGHLQWPVSNGNQSAWLGWCHGNAGYVFLWSLAFQQLKEERFLLLAEKTGAALFFNRPQTGSLCCGLAGEAYALLKLFEVTGNESYLLQARTLKDRLLQDLSAPDLRNHSLYKGDVGVALLMCEMKRPELAHMPLFS